MIQFDDIIFFKWVGKNHQLDFVSFLWLFCSSFCFSDYFFVFQLCQFWVMILVKRSKHKNFVSPKTIKTQRSWCSGCEREENKKRVLKHLEKWPAVDQNGEWRNGQFFKLLHELEGGGDRVYKQNSSGRLVPFWASYGAMDVLSFFFLDCQFTVAWQINTQIEESRFLFVFVRTIRTSPQQPGTTMRLILHDKRQMKRRSSEEAQLAFSGSRIPQWV